jgi:hypothetical protein
MSTIQQHRQQQQQQQQHCHHQDQRKWPNIQQTRTAQENAYCSVHAVCSHHTGHLIIVPVVTTQPEASSVGIDAVVWLMAGLFVFIVGVPLLLPVCLFVCLF